MQRTARELTDVEIIDAFEDIITLICDLYKRPVRREYQKASRAAQLGHDIVDHLMERDILDRFEKIGYQTQVKLMAADIIEPGDGLRLGRKRDD